MPRCILVLLTLLLAGCADDPAAPHPAPAAVFDLVYLGPDASGTGPARIWIAPTDGGAPRRVPLPAMGASTTIDDIAPSPDGRRVAFTATTYDAATSRFHMDVWVVNRDGTGARRLTTEPDVNEEQPAWSPDGTRLAYRRTPAGGDSDIWVMRADGTQPVNLTPGAGAPPRHEEWPAWSPDGRRIAYGALVPPTAHAEIWTARADGTGRVRLTSDTTLYDWEPAWSPDGTRIAFARASLANRADIAILHVAGPRAGAVDVLALPVSQLSPAWTPDGRELAFASNHEGRFEIYTARPDGEGLRRRTTTPLPGALEPAGLRRP